MHGLRLGVFHKTLQEAANIETGTNIGALMIRIGVLGEYHRIIVKGPQGILFVLILYTSCAEFLRLITVEDFFFPLSAV